MLGNVSVVPITHYYFEQQTETNQSVRESCAGMIPEWVMNVQINMYSIYKKTGISRLDPHRLTQPLQSKYQVR